MKNRTSSNKLLLLIVILSASLGMYTYVRAQTDIVRLLSDRFDEQNLPVTEVEVLSNAPLRLRIVVQGTSDFVASEDKWNLHSVDRDVIIFARQQGFLVESFTKILLNNSGEEIYKQDHYIDPETLSLATTDTFDRVEKMSDDSAQKLIEVQINLLIDKYDLGTLSFEVDVEPLEENLQILNILLSTPSRDEAYNASGLFVYKIDAMVEEVNAQGGRIVVYNFKMSDANGNFLMSNFFDLQLQSGSWSHSENFPIELFGPPPPSSP